MSYCRWSSDGYRCDLYAYEDVAGCWTIHIAGRRSKMQAPLLTNYLKLKKDGKSWEEKGLRDFNKAHHEWRKEQDLLSDEERYEDINLEHDGKTFRMGTLGAFRDKMVELMDMGYMCDRDVLVLIDEEIDEHGRGHTTSPAKGVTPEHVFKGDDDEISD